MSIRPILVLPTSGSIYNDGATFELVETLLETARILKEGNLSLVDGPSGAVCDYRSSKLRIKELRSYGSNAPSRLVISLPKKKPIEIGSSFHIQGDPNDVDMKRPAAYASKEISESLIRRIDAMVFHTEPALAVHGLEEDPILPHHLTGIIGEHIATLLRNRHHGPGRIAIRPDYKVHSTINTEDVSYGAEYEFAGDDGEPTKEGLFGIIPVVAHIRRNYERNWDLSIAHLEGLGSESPIDAMISTGFFNKLHAVVSNSLPWDPSLISQERPQP